jgi:site-specific DNA recombinase
MARATKSSGGIAFYSRFSSDLQNPRSCDAQEEELAARARRDGLDADRAECFRNEAISGSVADRPGLRDLIERIKAGAVHTLYIEAPDRLSRNAADSAQLANLFNFHGVRLVALNGAGLDGSPGSTLVFGVMAAVAQNYVAELGHKTLRGQRDSARNGKSTGGRCYGYQTNPTTKAVEILPEQAEVVREVFRLYLEGHSVSAIATDLNRRGVEPPRNKRRAGEGWMVTTLRSMLRNSRYVGEVTFGRLQYRRHPETRKRTARRADPAEAIAVQHPDLAIVSRELWNAVVAKLTRNTREYVKPAGERGVLHRRTDYLLSGVLRCAECGGFMEIMRGTSMGYYRCANGRKRGTCSNVLSVREDVAKDAIIGALSDRLWNPETLIHIRETAAHEVGAHRRKAEADLKERTARLARIEERSRALVTMMLDGDRAPTVRTMLADSEAQVVQERAAIDALRAELALVA